MQILSIKTHCITQAESLEKILDKYITSITEQDILAVTSKVISICQSMVVKKNNINKEKLIQQEADLIAKVENRPYGVYLTIKNNIIIPSAGIDESNGDAAFIAKALGNIAKAKGMAQLSRDTGLGRESLYKALSGDVNPSFDTVIKVVKALNLRLAI